MDEPTLWLSRCRARLRGWWVELDRAACCDVKGSSGREMKAGTDFRKTSSCKAKGPEMMISSLLSSILSSLLSYTMWSKNALHLTSQNDSCATGMSVEDTDVTSPRVRNILKSEMPRAERQDEPVSTVTNSYGNLDLQPEEGISEVYQTTHKIVVSHMRSDVVCRLSHLAVSLQCP
jgi:hypothetical protein